MKQAGADHTNSKQKAASLTASGLAQLLMGKSASLLQLFQNSADWKSNRLETLDAVRASPRSPRVKLGGANTRCPASFFKLYDLGHVTLRSFRRLISNETSGEIISCQRKSITGT